MVRNRASVFGVSKSTVQRDVFERQFAIAADVGKPVVLHCRNTMEDMLDILRRYAPLRGVMHCFDGWREILDEVTGLGLHVGIGGEITYEQSVGR